MLDAKKIDICDGSESEDENTVENKKAPKKSVYLPGTPLRKGEELVFDKSAYIMFHKVRTPPCLSFDVIEDDLGENREEYPLTTYLVAGTQAHKHVNYIVIWKIHNLHKFKDENEDEDDKSSDEEDDKSSDDEVDEVEEPKFTTVKIKHRGGVNRIRSYNHNGVTLASSWSELGIVHIWNLTEQLQAVDNRKLLNAYNNQKKNITTKPLFSFKGHQIEGFSMDWCRTSPGVTISIK